MEKEKDSFSKWDEHNPCFGAQRYNVLNNVAKI
jgi:hypothetical protein